MNKKIINASIPYAYEALKDAGIVTEEEGSNVIDKKYKGQIASFGAAISMGSLLSAVAFFSDKGQSEVDRYRILDAILIVLQKQNKADGFKKLYEYISAEMKNNVPENVLKDEIINVTIAVKLAMNLYVLKPQKGEVR